MNNYKEKAIRVANLIWEDLDSRSGAGIQILFGLGHRLMDQIDDETKQEMLEEWCDIITENMI